MAKKNLPYFDQTHSLWTDILKNHVSEQGHRYLFNYHKLKQNPLPLQKYIQNLSEVSLGQFQKMSKKEQQAFLINVYNANLIQLIIRHYPIKTIQELNGTFSSFLDENIIHLFGHTIGLNNLRHDWIEKKSFKPAIIFALTQGTLGHPPLLPEAYIASKLTSQLEYAKKNFIKNHENNYFDFQKQTLWLSPVLKENKNLFIQKKINLKKFVANDLAEGPKEKKLILSKRSKIKFVEYNWNLNDFN